MNDTPRPSNATANLEHVLHFSVQFYEALESALGTDAYPVKVDDRELDFLASAERYVNQLDPLHPTSRDPDPYHERTFHGGTEATYRDSERQWLAGHAWESSLKCAAAQGDDWFSRDRLSGDN